MTKQTKLNNADNGYVSMSEEAVLSGATAATPEDICTKYPETCTSLQVDKADCNNVACCPTTTSAVVCPPEQAYTVDTAVTAAFVSAANPFIGQFTVVVTNTGTADIIGGSFAIVTQPTATFTPDNDSSVNGNIWTVDIPAGQSATLVVDTTQNTDLYNPELSVVSVSPGITQTPTVASDTIIWGG